MQILLAAATEGEIAPFLKENNEIDFLITGVGNPVSVYQFTKKLHQGDYDIVIQAGIAGSFTNTLKLGAVVLVREDHFADLGISEKDQFHTVFEKGFADEDLFPFAKGWLRNDEELLNKFSLQKVRAVTVNTVSDSKIQMQQLISKFSPQIETMEGAALHYVCMQEGMPFLQLRSISNYVGERDKLKWKMKDAIENLNTELKKIINKLTV